MEHPTLFDRERTGRTTVVGVLNLTPDSFSDGGRFVAPSERVDVPAALAEGLALTAAGAHVLDIGGESTRPGALEVSAPTEIQRTAPVIEALAKATDLPISIDTRKSEVARAAIDAGATIVNDVSGLATDPALAELAARTGVWLVLGHMRGVPATMQHDPHFADVLEEVGEELRHSVGLATQAGMQREKLVIDPGIGFGKDLSHNLSLLANAGRHRRELGLPLLVGPSRKSFLGRLTGDPTGEREIATQAACAVAIFAGADAVRVHDVGAACKVARVADALRDAREDVT